ncbi:MAG: DNA-formamidopyrimidine glycosylase [Firmicutes bacterium]|nr:DNA-formamidopyrimidine glycosylase [Bacillota bacterium]
MPELPEVETIKETLKLQILNKTIHNIFVFYDKIITNSSEEEFKKKLIGETLIDIKRYGKYLFFIFNHITLVSHLRMEGKYFLKPKTDPFEKHEHIIFEFTDGLTLRYHDVRKFGTMELKAIGEELSAKGVSTLGIEPFELEFTSEYLKNKIHNSSRPIKSLLLDQTIVCGLGNIYVDEVLFLSKIHPKTQGKNLNDFDISQLIVQTPIVLNKAILLGGTTIRSYVSSLGVSGRFQNELNVHTLKGKSCKVCSQEIVKIKVGGRGTYFCPTCQIKSE